MHRLIAAIVGAGLALFPLSCAQLPVIEPNTCGDGVVEGREQCDMHEDLSLAKKGEILRCADPSDVLRACRYVCSQSDPTAPQCPTGWGCSAGGTCHYASGTYEESGDSPYDVPKFQDMQIKDVDGDGRPDLVTASETNLSIRYGKTGGTFATLFSFDVVNLSSHTAIGDLEKSGRESFVIPSDLGPIVLRGQRDRTLAPVFFNHFNVQDALNSGATWVRALPTQATVSCSKSPDAAVKDSVIIVTASEAQMTVFYPPTSDQLLFNAQSGYQGLAMTPSRFFAGPFDPTSGFASIIVALPGNNKISVYRQGCTIAQQEHPVLSEPIDIALPAGFRVARQPMPTTLAGLNQTQVQDSIRLGDIDGDHVTDILIFVENADPSVPADQKFQVAVSKGVTPHQFKPAELDVRFETIADDFTPLGATTSTSPTGRGSVALGAQRWPIAVGDLNGDGIADYVGTSGVFISGSMGLMMVSAPAHGYWSEALITDINADGVMDVAAVNPEQREIEVYLHTSTATAATSFTSMFNAQYIATGGRPGNLRAGDFNGDGAADVGFVDAGMVYGTSLSILYGDPSPNAQFEVVPIGSPGVISDLEPVHIENEQISDLVVVIDNAPNSAKGDFSVGALYGRKDKTMVSPFVVTDSTPNLDRPLIIDRALLGRFGNTQNNLDLLAFNETDFWIAPGDGTGRFLHEGTKQYSMHALLQGAADAFRPDCIFFDVADVDSNPMTDEVISVAGENCLVSAGGTSMPSGSPQTGRSSFQIVGRTASDMQGMPRAIRYPLPEEFQRMLGMRVADLDQNGRPDLIFAFAPSDATLAAAAKAASGTIPKGGVVIYWNPNADLDKQTVTFSSDPTLIHLGEGFEFPLAVAALNADDDTFLELAVVTYGVDMLSAGARTTAKTYIVKVLGQNAGAAPQAVLSNAITPLQNPQLEARDVDGDGLTDLIYADGAQVRVYLAVPHGLEKK